MPGTRDGAFDRELRQYAVRAKFVGDDARSRSVTRHVHCVRAVELAFFKHCHSRYVLCRDEPGQGESVIERRTPAEFLALLENDEQRQKMCVSAKLALGQYLPLDRAFALYAPNADQETHWFNERHALRLAELERSGELLDALKPIVARFRDDATRRTHSGRMNKMFGWMLALAGPRAAAQLAPFTEPLFWIRSGDGPQHRLCQWLEAREKRVGAVSECRGSVGARATSVEIEKRTSADVCMPNRDDDSAVVPRSNGLGLIDNETRMGHRSRSRSTSR